MSAAHVISVVKRRY